MATESERGNLANEAVGQRDAIDTPDAVKRKTAVGVSEPATQERAKSTPPDASISMKTAEAIGEQATGAYAHPNATSEEVHARSAMHIARNTSAPPSLLPVVAALMIGYAAGFVIHGR